MGLYIPYWTYTVPYCTSSDWVYRVRPETSALFTTTKINVLSIFGLTPSVGDKHERNASILEGSQAVPRTGQHISTPHKNAVDVESLY